MGSFDAKPPCNHGLTDQVEITNRTVVEDYRHRTRSVLWGYWCRVDKSFGHFMIKETNVKFLPRESTAPPAANA